MRKIIDKNDFVEIRKHIKSENKKIVLCHGVFDLLHPGHIQHFQEAKVQGDILVVSVTDSQYVRKGPGRPYFNNEQRLQSLAALECIDYVILSQNYTVSDVVQIVQPDLYVKGAEYQNAEEDITGKISEEVELVKKYGGEVYFTNGEVFSSTKLINQVFPVFSDETKRYLSIFKEMYTMEGIQQYVNTLKKLKVLVIGDVIIDDYIFCTIQGLMSKNNGYSARFIKEEKYFGGSIAIARHLAEFCPDVSLMSIIGCEEDTIQGIEDTCEKIHLKLIRSSSFSTIVKKRYVEPDDKRKDLNKIFVINNLSQNMGIEDSLLEKFHQQLERDVSKYDAVFLCDFGHGLIDETAMRIIENKAQKLILNCQTNSSNYGRNLITKYKKADFFSIDEKELQIAFGDYTKTWEEQLSQLGKRLNAQGWLTRGSKGATAITDNKRIDCPALALDVVDTIGAGDAFYSMAGLMAIAGAPVEVGMFMGNVAGAIAANIIGNKKSINKVDVLKFVSTLLKE